MVADSYDAVVVGAGGDGPVAAWKLGEAGLSVLVLEAGPFHGNEQWPKPHEEPGGEASSSPEDLSGELFDEQFTGRDFGMTNELLFGPADHERGFWVRKYPGSGTILQCAGVGGSTLHYGGNHPRAYPAAIDEQGHWPIDYADLLPYYEDVESMCEVRPAPTTPKAELFARGADAAGWDLLEDKNVTEPGYRPQPNAVKHPDEKLHVDENYEGPFTYPDVEGDTLARNHVNNHHPEGAPFEEKAKQSSNVSFVPAALETGNVTVRPNAFVTDVRTETHLGDEPTATGVQFRDTWSGETETVDAEVVVLAAGAVETPRLWLNSDLPDNGWVGKGMTLHFLDNVVGLWDADDVAAEIGQPRVDQHVGQDSSIRFDHPGLGTIQTAGATPGVGAFLGLGASAAGFAFQHDPAGAPWDTIGRIAGADLKEFLADYRRMLPLFVLTDDRPRQRNGVSVVPGVADEHGPIAQVNYEPSEGDRKRRDELAGIAAEILREAGASHVHRSDSPLNAIHVHSTMAMGKVLDEACEAHDVERLFVADHSALANGVGGANPTNTGQALAARTADRIVERYF